MLNVTWNDAADYKYDAGAPTDDPQGPDSGGYVRAVRGGSWMDDPVKCRSAKRLANSPTNRLCRGFRVVCVVAPEQDR